MILITTPSGSIIGYPKNWAKGCVPKSVQKIGQLDQNARQELAKYLAKVSQELTRNSEELVTREVWSMKPKPLMQREALRINGAFKRYNVRS